MIDILKKIDKKKVILFGEIHGTKEIPNLLSDFFSDLSKRESFNVCFEIPSNQDDFFTDKNQRDGRNSLEYFNLINKLKELRNVKIHFVDINDAKDIKNRDKIIADNVLKALDKNKTFAVLGNIHASKNKIIIGSLNIIPAGFLIYQRLKGEMCSVLLKPKNGEFFNNGLKKITYRKDDIFDKGFDYAYELNKVSPCSFL